MKRLTTDNPNGNYENAHNLFYIKNLETWVRGGEEPNFKDVTLNEFMRSTIRKNNLNYDLSTDDEDLMDQLYERLFDGNDTMEGVVALLNAAAWALSEMRERLKVYEDAEEQGLLVRLDEKTALAIAAGACAIENNKRLFGTTYMWDIFRESGDPKEISFVKAMQILRKISEPALTREEADAALKERERHED